MKVFDYIIIPFKIARSRKQKANSFNQSLYKEQKCGIHTTINGKGCIARLFKQR
jgi:hypothetical protein